MDENNDPDGGPWYIISSGGKTEIVSASLVDIDVLPPGTKTWGPFQTRDEAGEMIEVMDQERPPEPEPDPQLKPDPEP